MNKQLLLLAIFAFGVNTIFAQTIDLEGITIEGQLGAFGTNYIIGVHMMGRLTLMRKLLYTLALRVSLIL